MKTNPRFWLLVLLPILCVAHFFAMMGMEQYRYNEDMEDYYFMRGVVGLKYSGTEANEGFANSQLAGDLLRKVALSEQPEIRYQSLRTIFPHSFYVNSGYIHVMPRRELSLSQRHAMGQFAERVTIKERINLELFQSLCFVRDADIIDAFCENPERVWMLINSKNSNKISFLKPSPFSWEKIFTYFLIPYCLSGLILLVMSVGGAPAKEKLNPIVRAILIAFFFPFAGIKVVVEGAGHLLKKFVRKALHKLMPKYMKILGQGPYRDVNAVVLKDLPWKIRFLIKLNNWLNS